VNAVCAPDLRQGGAGEAGDQPAPVHSLTGACAGGGRRVLVLPHARLPALLPLSGRRVPSRSEGVVSGLRDDAGVPGLVVTVERLGVGRWRWGMTLPGRSLAWCGRLVGTSEGGVESVDPDDAGYWVTAVRLAALDKERRWVEYDLDAARWAGTPSAAAGQRRGGGYRRSSAEGAQGAGATLGHRARRQP
jgi:hypothetical protein